MNTDYLAARRTCPSFFFLLDEISHSEMLYFLKIIYHAHAVSITVPLIQPPQLVAGKIIALVAKSYSIICQVIATLPGTIPVLGPTPGTTNAFIILTFRVSGIPHVGPANTAVHPARRYQLLGKCRTHTTYPNRLYLYSASAYINPSDALRAKSGRFLRRYIYFLGFSGAILF